MLYEPVKLGVIGCQSYSLQLIKRILSVPDAATLVGVMAVDVGSDGARYCRERDIPVFETVAELLASGSLEAVFNPTPIHLHVSITKQCLAAGIPVFMEKPPVATVQDLDDLQAAAAAAGLPVAVCFNSIFSWLLQNLKTELVAGRYGRIRRIKGVGAWLRGNGYFAPPRWHGKVRHDDQWVLSGTINNPFAHVLCDNLFLAAPEHHALAEPMTVEAELYRCNEIESEDTSCLRVMTREGIEVLTWLTLCPEVEIPPRTVIETEHAVITYEDFKTLTIAFRDGSVETHEAYQEDRIEMIRQLCRAIRTGERFRCDIDMIRPFTQVVNCAFESAGSICPIPEQHLRGVKTGAGTCIEIDGVGAVLQQAFDNNALFSELAVPWARKSPVFNAENYTAFPVRFEAVAPAEAVLT